MNVKPTRRPYRDRFRKPAKEPLPMQKEPLRMLRKGELLPKDYGIRAAGFGWPCWVIEDKHLRF